MYIAYTAIYVYNHSYTNNLSRDWPHLLNLDCLHQHHQPEKSTEDIFLKLPATQTHTKTNAQKKKVPKLTLTLAISTVFPFPPCCPPVQLIALCRQSANSPPATSQAQQLRV